MLGLTVGVTRPLALPPDVPVVAIGGATFGGSGKTPLAIACAKALARAGARVALVGHAYRARPRRARVVREDDALEEVGDEALVCARALGAEGVDVVVAPRRVAAIDFALGVVGAQVLVLDGVLQASPRRVDLSVLAVDTLEVLEASRWGWNLRAPPHVLRRASDLVVPTGDDARTVSRGVSLGGKLVSWSEVTRLRVGLFCALAHHERLVRWLSRRGVFPVRIVRTGDHGPRGPLARAAMYARLRAAKADRLDMWIASEKCALHLASLGGGSEGGGVGGGAEVGGGGPPPTHKTGTLAHVIDHAVELSPELARALSCLDRRARRQ